MTAAASKRGRRNRAAGKKREYDVADYLESPIGGLWVVAFRRRHKDQDGESKQGFDLMALRIGESRLIEVKSTPTPFKDFGPRDRELLIQRATQAGAVPVLAHWPYDGGGLKSLRFYGCEEWPS